jgi:hypothetical protein
MRPVRRLLQALATLGFIAANVESLAKRAATQ